MYKDLEQRRKYMREYYKKKYNEDIEYREKIKADRLKRYHMKKNCV